MLYSNEFAVKLEDRHQKLRTASQKGAAVNISTWAYLQASEQQLIALMNGPVPPQPDAPGNIEFSWCLYFLNGKIPDVPEYIRVILAGIQDVLRDMGMPSSNISSDDWNKWMTEIEGQGALMGDGTWVSTALYAVVDLSWSLALIDYILVETGEISIVNFNQSGKDITIPARNTLQIALFGDWGTGAYQDGDLSASPSQLVMQQIGNKKPDLSIHLGDVYYSGTQGFFPHTGEEYLNLVQCWKYVAPLGNFTMNSNHEMYDGANGLFNVALNNSVTTMFQDQGGSTFFSVCFGNWIILGLDSAYNASQMYMQGVISDPYQQQLLQNAGKSGKKIFILTHHNPINEIGDTQNSLWNDVVSQLGKNPDYWYWGHVHNGIVYSNKSAGGNVNCRCLGNAAIPIGNASWFENNSQINFFTNKPLSNPGSRNALRVMNGFAIIEFSEDAVSEQWYYQDGSSAWSS